MNDHEILAGTSAQVRDNYVKIQNQLYKNKNVETYHLLPTQHQSPSALYVIIHLKNDKHICIVICEDWSGVVPHKSDEIVKSQNLTRYEDIIAWDNLKCPVIVDCGYMNTFGRNDAFDTLHSFLDEIMADA